jgi:hypothetical protein
MPVAGDSVRFKNRGSALDMDQDHHGGRHCDWGCRMHYYAKGAMVGCGLNRVNVCHLDQGEQCKQEKTYHRDHRQATMLCPAFPTEIFKWSCQYTSPYVKNTLCWMFESGKRYLPVAAFLGLGSHRRLIPNV